MCYRVLGMGAIGICIRLCLRQRSPIALICLTAFQSHRLQALDKEINKAVTKLVEQRLAVRGEASGYHLLEFKAMETAVDTRCCFCRRFAEKKTLLICVECNRRAHQDCVTRLQTIDAEGKRKRLARCKNCVESIKHEKEQAKVHAKELKKEKTAGKQRAKTIEREKKEKTVEVEKENTLEREMTVEPGKEPEIKKRRGRPPGSGRKNTPGRESRASGRGSRASERQSRGSRRSSRKSSRKSSAHSVDHEKSSAEVDQLKL
ncbi:hypothetical protein L596_005574 [Steinernema carpocapsae]|uniref:PHD-type domain-containing protein n=1 Tax=Steinernema carpocapsae TaxID=34508 RepID=A0A4U8V3D9_STECR|nr:hypothetical protein L596_005574 [Steinernema carpocapsae]